MDKEQANILVVEDDEDINGLLRRYLEREGYRAVSAFSGSEAKLQLTLNSFDLILLDLMIPGITGEALITETRSRIQTPILVISAKSTLEDKVSALKNGADDYMTKPFERDEVLARVGALLRRSRLKPPVPEEKNEYAWKQLALNSVSREAFVKGSPISLTAFEFDILLLFLKHPDRVFTKEQLYRHIWKTGYYGEDNTINVHISNIRRKIKEYDDDSYIRTVWGIGYKL